jgi:hypothetical protein
VPWDDLSRLKKWTTKAVPGKAAQGEVNLFYCPEWNAIKNWGISL